VLRLLRIHNPHKGDRPLTGIRDFRSDRRSASWPAILLASVILLPYLGKAHTIDDVTFLLQAEHVLKDPLHPTAFEMLSDGNRVRLSSLMVSGPAMAYLLVPSVLLGGAEWAAHLVQFLFVIAAILATVSLAMRLGIDRRGARVSGLMIASTPAVMGMATTSMPDVPAMAFAVLGMERFFAWRQERRWHQGFAAALGFALAILSRPHLILLLAVAAICLLITKTAAKNHVPIRNVFDKRPAHFILGKFVEAIPLIVAAFIAILAAVLTSDPGRIHGDFLGVGLSRFAQSKIATNLAAFFLHWVLVFPLALVWVAMGVRWKTLWRNPAIYLALGVSFCIVLLDKKNHWVPATVLFLAFVGAFLILDIFFDSWRRRDGVQFFLVAWLLIALPAIGYVQLPSKYLIGSTPAVALILAKLYGRSRAGAGFVLSVAVSAGVVFSLLIIAADARFASFEKTIAFQQIAPRAAKGIRVWANGEWGFEWYALKAGAIPVASQPPHPSPGDVLVSSSATPHLPLDRFPNRVFIAECLQTSSFGRVMNSTARVGFYSNAYGYFPWTWRNGEIEDITIWKIQ